MKIISQQYGKARVRVMKLLKDGPVHTVKELTVKTLLDGPTYGPSYTAADNSMVVPTDTVKNTINCLAFDQLGPDTELFALALANHFLTKYDHITRVIVETEERLWTRTSIDGTPHPHTFTQAQPAIPIVKLEATATTTVLESGIKDLLILKSTEAGFSDYPKCDFTTLKETRERIVATSLLATWLWNSDTPPTSYSAANATILNSFMKPFAEKYSESVQQNLWDMGTLALETVPEITRISLAAPNKHCNLIDLTPFNRENHHTLFVPTDEPHGQIEVTIGR
ncbi:urate oxidase [Phragmitibacter flavus]|uniref:Uricase n=1 Tax=Phragmitibacter flavus TaxID=2576071 RepID=A0A5R8KIR6_9BACT|nr:urate oxidase [Phragmitibacter flavus]TLD72150.1 urate oxidase [Phragmitibacter flavus]